MIMGLSDFLRALADRFHLLRHDEETEDKMNDEPPRAPDRAEIENAIATFKELISRLSRNGTEIGELYLSAERKAARYALLSENVVESVTSGIIAVDGMHEICLANSAAKRTLGCDEAYDLTGRQLKALFEDHKQLETLVSGGFRSCRNAYRKVINVTLHGGTSMCLGVSTSCVTSGKSEPEAVIIVFTELDRDATGMISGEAGSGGATAEAYRRGMLDAYGIVSEIYTDIEGLRAEIEKGDPDVTRLAGAAERVEFACDLMVAFALSKTASGAMTELVDLNGTLRDLLESKGLSGRRVVARLEPNLPRISTLRRILDAGLDMLLKGCLAESGDGVEVVTRMEGPEDRPTVTLSIMEMSPTMPIVEVGDQPRGFLKGAGLRREIGLMMLKSLPGRGHAVAVNRNEESFTYSLSFLLPKLNKEEKRTTSGGFTDTESGDGDMGQ
jgi:hypothetical protein